VTEQAVALLNVRQRSKGAVLVAPRRHACRLADLEATEVQKIGDLIRRVAAAVTTAFDPDGMHVWCGGGILAGQSEPHVHFQVVPRYAGIDYSFATSHALSRTAREERREVARQIREALRTQALPASAS
jgi:diadenosine tetraphosphate (Ap4A) HIT family hydrolase